MDTPAGQTQSNTRAEHQKTLRFKEGIEMKTPMGMDKVKVWISEKLGAKIATRVFRGLAVGVLLAAGTGLYFSINQGEAGSPSSGSEITQALEVEELEAAVIGVPAYLGSKAAVDFEVVRLLTSEQIQDLPGFMRTEVWLPGETYAASAVTQHEAVRPLSIEQLELIQDLEMTGFLWRIDDQGRVVVVEAPRPSFSPCPAAQTEVWHEIEETPICHLMKVR